MSAVTNPSGFTPELERLCEQRCADIAGDPPCWRLPELVQPCEQITPCAECLADAKPKRQMTIASFCAMTCAEGGFHKFLDEHFSGIYPPCETKEHAAEIVTTYCGVESRRELNVKGPEQELWLALQSQYQDWLRT